MRTVLEAESSTTTTTTGEKGKSDGRPGEGGGASSAGGGEGGDSVPPPPSAASSSSSSAPSESPPSLPSLPQDVTVRVLEFLRLGDRRSCLSSSYLLWSNRSEVESKHSTLAVPRDAPEEEEDEDEARASSRRSSIVPPSPLLHGPGGRAYFAGLNNLRSLDVGPLATDDFLRYLSGFAVPNDTGGYDGGTGGGEELLPRLESICMVGSDDVTDGGLVHLSVGRRRSVNLRRIDVTFCRRTTYAGTFPLRDNLRNLEVVRRQPDWLDGTFVTPFRGAPGLDDGRAELHVYWADGTFSFNRGVQSSGFVCDLFPLEGGEDGNGGGGGGVVPRAVGGQPAHLGDRLQYTDFDPPPGWPGWARYCYRPGVSLLRLPDEVTMGDDGTAETLRSVLVAQRLEGIRAPADAPHPSHVGTVPLGESRTFDRSGDPLPDDEDDDGSVLGANRHPDRYTLVSRMRVLPLPHGGDPMPPEALVRNNREFCDDMRREVSQGVWPFSQLPPPAHHQQVTAPAAGGGADGDDDGGGPQAAAAAALLGPDDVHLVLEAGEETLHRALIRHRGA